MLRALLLLLLLANGLFQAWTRGWLTPLAEPPQAGQREPQRLAAQLHPERLTVLGVGPAGSAAAPTACLELGPVTPAQRPALEAALAAAGVPAGAWEPMPASAYTSVDTAAAAAAAAAAAGPAVSAPDAASALADAAQGLQRLRVPAATAAQKVALLGQGLPEGMVRLCEPPAEVPAAAAPAVAVSEPATAR
jgi:hypothetical protein